MSFYGMVVLVTVLVLIVYLYAFMGEVNSLSWIAAAYAKCTQIVSSAQLTGNQQ